MEWWQYVVSTLAGVLVGGFFTYLGLRSQLKQQKDINEREWRRKVKSEPLLKLREELARMASKVDIYSASIIIIQAESELGLEKEAMKDFEKAGADWEAYHSSGDLSNALYLQDDLELYNQVHDIWGDYMLQANRISIFTTKQDITKLSEEMKNVDKVRMKIIKVQELINKRLEAL